MRLGLISDTHNLLRPEVFSAFEGVDHILHAGDVGDEDILVELRAIAPVTAVWGNTDGWPLRERLPERAELELAGASIRVVHGHQYGSPKAADLGRANSDVDLLLFGHSHKPEVERVAGTLVVNPGSAGPRRFGLPVGVAIADIDDGRLDARLVHLLDPSASGKRA